MNRAKGIGPCSWTSRRMIDSRSVMKLTAAGGSVSVLLPTASRMAKIDAFFNLMFEQKASDLHLSSGNPPILRIHGELQRVDYPPLENDALKAMLYEIAPEYKIKSFEETGDVDFGYEIPNIARFRANFFNQKNGISAVFRQIPNKVVSFEDFEKIDAPLPPVLKKFSMLHRGL